MALFPRLLPIGDRRRMETGFRVVMRHHFGLGRSHGGKLVGQDVSDALVVLLPGTF